MEPEALRYRVATEDDLGPISAMQAEAAAWLSTAGQPLWTSDEVSESVVAPRLMSGEYRVLERGSDIVASCRLQCRDPDFWPDAGADDSRYLHRLVVVRAHTGQGLALQLIDAAAGEASQAGCEWLRLDCAADRPALRRLYTGAGFTLRDERTCLRWHVARFELALPSN